jgi:hypothetical protein
VSTLGEAGRDGNAPRVATERGEHCADAGLTGSVTGLPVAAIAAALPASIAAKPQGFRAFQERLSMHLFPVRSRHGAVRGEWRLEWYGGN